MSKYNYILGDGIAGYVIAACLDHEEKDFTIYGNDTYLAPNILLLNTHADCSQVDEYYTNDGLIREYFEVFRIKDTYENRKKYIKKIKIGYKTKNGITQKPKVEDIAAYYKKQNRKVTYSGMSDGENTFYAIDLVLVYYHLRELYSKHFVKTDITKDMIKKLKEKKFVNIFNTIIPTTLNDNKPENEYIDIEKNDIGDYTYVYDCVKSSPIKRITSQTKEYFCKPETQVVFIKNYYDNPKIYITYDSKIHSKWIDISRNATKTQLKIEDIIEYFMLEDI